MLAVLLPGLLLAAALPLAACADPCVVEGTALAPFAPLVAVLRSGQSVAWHALDGGSHYNTEGLLAAEYDGCLQAGYVGTQASAPVRLVLEEDGLWAEGEAGQIPCLSEDLLPDGSALLGYQCAFHAATMKGWLLVAP